MDKRRKTFTILPDESLWVDLVIYNGQKVTLPLVNNQFTTPPIVADNSLKVVFKGFTGLLYV